MNGERRFQRTIENFVCEQCAAQVVGSGYTNHCPQCLWSKHVDVHPGDRAAKCGGLMKPTEVERTGSAYVLTHQCKACGHTKRNKVSAEDSFDALTVL